MSPAERLLLLAPFVEARRLERMRAVLALRTSCLTFVLDRLYDPNNVAACLRTADALGLQDVHVVAAPKTSPRGLRAEPGRAVSLDAARWLTVHRHADATVTLAALAAGGYRIGVASPGEGAVELADIDVAVPTAIVFGAERDGVAPELAAAATFSVSLPMRGFAQSLNVSVAMALVMAPLRDRLEREALPEVWMLPEARREALLDRWVHADVAHADRILVELAARSRRQTASSPSPSAPPSHVHDGNGGPGRAKR